MNLKRTTASIILLLAVNTSTQAAQDFTVHEWGTFTSFFGSDGKKIEGMHYEEEPLPKFVYGYNNLGVDGGGITNLRDVINDCPQLSKVPCQFFDQAPEALPVNPINVGVTQKMETPVIYFYGETGKQINVKVDFPKGIHAQFYPRPSSFFPAVDAVKELGPSQIQYQLTLLEPTADGLPTTSNHSIWNPARVVPDANVIDVNGEREKFIFYRGLGNFDDTLSLSSKRGNKVELINTSNRPHAAIFILNVENKKAAIRSITPQLGTQTIAIPEANVEIEEYLLQAKKMVQSALVQAGLFEDEAKGLVNTWEKSYFKQPGPRVLYLLHPNDVERILPMEITPAPDHIERVLVGRLEFLSKQQERKLLIDLVSGELNLQHDRFAEPKLRRLEVLVDQSTQLDANQKVTLKVDIATRIYNIRSN